MHCQLYGKACGKSCEVWNDEYIAENAPENTLGCCIVVNYIHQQGTVDMRCAILSEFKPLYTDLHLHEQFALKEGRNAL